MATGPKGESMFKTSLLAGCIAVLVAVAGADAARADVGLGVLANRGELKALSAWGGFAEYLGKEIGEPVKLLPLTADKVLGAVASGEAQFIITNPVQSAAIVKQAQGTPLATIDQGEGIRFGGVIIANPKSGIRTSADLRGKKVMSYTPASAGAYVFQRYHLFKQGIDVTKDFAVFQEAKKQDDIVLAVRAGMMDAGFVRTGLVESMAATGKLGANDLIVVDRVDDPSFGYARTTALYPEWFLSASPKADPALAAKIKAAALRLPATSPAAQAAEVRKFEEPAELDGLAALLTELKMPPFDR